VREPNFFKENIVWIAIGGIVSILGAVVGILAWCFPKVWKNIWTKIWKACSCCRRKKPDDMYSDLLEADDYFYKY